MKIVLKRFLLILLGILLSLVVLELSLRLAGFAVSSYQQYKNNKALKNKSQYTIMCLGESTTAAEYPIQLQQILNKKYPNKFSVIDCGIPGTTLETILETLDQNIKKYNPDIAVCMMGINDGLFNFEKDNKKIYKPKLKIYKLYLLLKQHIKSLSDYGFLFAQNTDTPEWLKQYLYFRGQKKYDLAEKILNDQILHNPDNQHAQTELLFLKYFFTSSAEEKDFYYNMAKNNIDNKIYTDIIAKSMCFNIIFYHNRIYLKNTDLEEMKFYANKIVTEDIQCFTSFKSYENYIFIKDIISENYRNIIISLFEKNADDNYFSFQAINYLEKKDYQKAQEYFDKAEELRLNFPNKETYDLYKQIVKKLIDNNIKVICMQYPIRSIKSLQEQLKNESYYDKITFISNEDNFKKAIINKNYKEIFVDQFAGDFGHCTDLGNMMIAKNIVKTLENLIN